MTQPLFRAFKQQLKGVLEKVRDNTSEITPRPLLFKNVYSEYPLARDYAAIKLPIATIWGDERSFTGSGNRAEKTTVETSIYIYFHEADYSKADEKMDYYTRDVISEIHKSINSWPVLVSVQVTGSSIAEVFKRLGMSDITIDPPYYGIRIDLTVEMGTAYT